MKRRRLFLAALVSLAAVSAGLVLANAGSPKTRPVTTPTPSLLVKSMSIEQAPGYTRQRLFTGKVQSARSSTLGFELGGRLVGVLKDEGESVRRGDVVAELDTERLRARRRELSAALEEADANLALAASTLRRFEDIVDRGAVTHQELDESRETWRSAQAGVVLARRRIESVDVDLKKSRLVAPFDGIVITRLADEGRVLSVGEVVLVLQESARPEIRVGLAGRFINALRPGETHTLVSDGVRFPARLRAVLPLRDGAARTVDALFDPIEAPAHLRTGDLVRLVLPDPVSEPGYWLPLSALTEGERGLWSVYVALPGETSPPAGLVATHRIARRTVQVLHQEADRVYVRGGLQADDQVVSDGLHRIVPGQWVRESATVADDRRQSYQKEG